jgi:hypothetical protein
MQLTNIVWFLHGLTDKYTWQYVHRFTDKHTGITDELKKFVPDHLVPSPCAYNRNLGSNFEKIWHWCRLRPMHHLCISPVMRRRATVLPRLGAAFALIRLQRPLPPLCTGVHTALDSHHWRWLLDPSRPAPPSQPTATTTAPEVGPQQPTLATSPGPLPCPRTGFRPDQTALVFAKVFSSILLWI